MASWQAHAVSFLLRHTFKPRLARARDASQARAVLNSGKFPVPAGVRITPAALGEIPAERVESAAGASAGVLLYLHGGGYIACSARTHRPYSTGFARQGFQVFAPDYRLAPEHPFPAGLLDALTAYRALRKEVGASVPIGIGGDSAGGGLALALLLKLREEADLLPVAAVLFSPLTDLAGTVASRRTNERRCAMFYASSVARVRDLYLDGTDPRDPLASPFYADLRGLPPLLIHVGEAETLRDDSTAVAEHARAAGVAVEIKVWPVVPHVWQLFSSFIPEGRQSLREAGEFLKHALARTNAQVI